MEGCQGAGRSTPDEGDLDACPLVLGAVMSKPSSDVRTLSLTVRVEIDADDPEFVEAQRVIGPGATLRHVVASEILSNLESVGYVRWARIHRIQELEGRRDPGSKSEH